MRCIRIRCHNNPGVAGGAGDGLVGAGVRGVGAARPALLPDPAYGAHGPPRGHLETAWIRRLCSPTGSFTFNINIFNRNHRC